MKKAASMQRMLSGLINFKTDIRPALKPLMKPLAQGQNPELLLFTCSDSRVVPHLITSEEPGEVFVVRTVGNLVAPADHSGLSVGDVSEASAIEYAIEVLGIREVAVCGHSNCGAMAALIQGRSHYEHTAPNLCHWLEHGEASRERAARMKFAPNLSPVDRLSQANVLQQLDHVASFLPIQKYVARGEVTLHALWFDIEHAMVHLFDVESGQFVALDEGEITRLISEKP